MSQLDEQLDEILNLIPHRPPFLWVDRIISVANNHILTEKDIPYDLNILQGHYPGNPIVPGVLLCEAIFQSGALFLAKNNSLENKIETRFPILTRIGNVKFKKTVFPGETLEIKVTLTESISTVSLMKGVLKVNGKIAVTVEFACAMLRTTP